jgi:hypothetical protein
MAVCAAARELAAAVNERGPPAALQSGAP